ncbi:MAG TPA: hypothetical protein VFC50_03010 [Candidatus Dormibacteraeota bacterium]|nr:hypothetical protein [Candidatus Dormibacteraeota bacterium]
MVCVHCGGKTKVVNSRPQRKNNQVWRRRQCLECGAVFSTKEIVQHELAWLVRDVRGKLRPFSRDKLFLSLYKSCEHRKTAVGDARGLTDTVMSKLPAYVADGTVSGLDIARVAQVALNRFDKAASTHYQAFHGA